MLACVAKIVGKTQTKLLLCLLLKYCILECSPGTIKLEKLLLLSRKYCISKRLKEVSYKLIHRVYPIKTIIVHRLKIAIDDKCVFCGFDPETIDNLFGDCSHVRRLLIELEYFILRETNFNVYLEN